jgi:hypothetical protein
MTLMPERLRLCAQGAGHGFERRLAGRVVAGARRAPQRADRGDVDDRAAPAGAHAGQRRLDQRDGTVEQPVMNQVDMPVFSSLATGWCGRRLSR